jgi:hypothetical protein
MVRMLPASPMVVVSPYPTGPIGEMAYIAKTEMCENLEFLLQSHYSSAQQDDWLKHHVVDVRPTVAYGGELDDVFSGVQSDGHLHLAEVAPGAALRERQEAVDHDLIHRHRHRAVGASRQRIPEDHVVVARAARRDCRNMSSAGAHDVAVNRRAGMHTGPCRRVATVVDEVDPTLALGA